MKKLADINAAKEYVRERADTVQIIREDLGDRTWKLEGSNTWVTTSPFREEKTPSFKVSVTNKKWKDWGGEQLNGDIFTWFQIRGGLRFEEAIFKAAERCKIDITQFLRDPTPEELLQSRYRQINMIATDFMHQLLRDNPIIRDNYLTRSGFTWDMIDPYQVGYCPSRDVLISHISSKIRLTEEDVDKLEFNRTELFTDTLVYPVHDHSGEVINFRTRKLSPPDSPYLGMRVNHPLHNPAVLYGFHEARKQLATNGGKLIVVEGQRDAIALRAVAVMGSALRDKQVEELKHYKIREIIICYDADETGWKKTLALVNDPQDFGDMLVLVARPNWVTDKLDVDPHDIWKEGGGEAVYKMLSRAMLPIEYYITQIFGDPGTLNITDKRRLLASLSEYLNHLVGIDLDIVASYLAKALDSSQVNVLDYISEIKANYSQLFNPEAERALINFCINNSISYNAAVAAGINKDAFTLSKYQKLFDACGIAYKRFADQYTAQAVLDEAMAKFVDPDLPGLVATIMGAKLKYEERAACDIVLDMYRRRTASTQAHKLISVSKDLSKSFIEIINEYRKSLIDSVSSSKPQATTPQELGDEFIGIVKERAKAGGNLIIGYDFYALPSINLTLGGIQPGHMIVIAGDTGAGKSAFGMNIMKCLAIDGGIPCLWIGQEMSSFENSCRLVSIDSGVHNSHIQAGALNARESKLVGDTYAKLIKSGYHCRKPHDGTIDEILAIIDHFRFKYGIKVVFWDYIQLVGQSSWQNRMSREQVIGHASKIIKNRVTEDMGLAAVIMAQLNRSDANTKVTQRIGGSYQISQDADDFLEIISKTKEQMKADGAHNGNKYIKVGKRRGGISDIMIHANLDTNGNTATLRLIEQTQPSEQAKLFAQLTS